jgi:protein-S-isoprenylcysteine O-methyltransferase Ste14
MSRYFFPKRYADAAQRLRVPCGFLLLVTFAFLSRPTRHSLWLGFPLSLAGLALRGWAGGHLAKNEHLATSGPYAWMRNPLYVGTVLTAGGLVISARSWWLLLVFVLSFALIYLPAVELEEQHLRNIFPSYARYAEQVSRFLPSRKSSDPQQPFSWPLYRRNEEYKAALGFLVAFLWLFWRARSL